MSINTFVYSHPINVYIIKYLGITVEQFCELHGYPQGTVASWITRQRRIKSLPASFVYDLSLASSLNMSDVYEKLLSLEQEYDSFKIKHDKKIKNIYNINHNFIILQYLNITIS
ncbi:replication control protein PrgN [Enterococcus faecium]|uniref:type III secretion system protein PrgN n=1 Tax=Enterococcus faecium TaxID=1352 RepID=UPI0010274028|nr:type III secretion system protein PrgN [Enterococcus faecium]VFA78199.1 replication control protein PrgN [Enterococcus faecium]